MTSRPTLRGTLAAAVAIVALLPAAWLLLRGAEAGGPTAFIEVMTRDSWSTLRRSLGLSFGVAALAVVISVPAAWLTEATDLPGRKAWRVLLTLPLAVPSYVSGFVVIAAFSPRGWLTQLGLVTPDVYGAFGATAALFFAYPYALLPIRASFARLDQSTWDAARSLGASPLEAFRLVVLPRLRPAVASGGLLVGLYALSDFGAVSLTRFRTLSYVIYLRYQSLFGRDEAVLYAWWLVGVAALLVVAHRLVAGRATRGVAAHPTRAWQPLKLGRWTWPALLYCSLVTFTGVVLPVVVVAYWLIRGISNGAEIHPFGDVAMRTVLVGLAGAAVVVLAALGPALMPATSKFTRVVRGAVHGGYALPGIVVALALVYFATHGVPVLYQTLPLLLLAYVIRFVPVAGGTLGEHADAQDPHLVEAARSLGRSRRQATVQVVLPLLSPALFAAFIAAFISIIKELPATLLVAPIEFDTLATHIWALTEEAFFTSVAAPILLLVAMSGLLIGVLQRSKS